MCERGVIFVVLPLSGLGLVERFLVDIGFSVMLTSGALATHRHVLLTWIIIMLTIAGRVVHWMGACIRSFPHRHRRQYLSGHATARSRGQFGDAMTHPHHGTFLRPRLQHNPRRPSSGKPLRRTAFKITVET
jgi:hypothetical protein